MLSTTSVSSSIVKFLYMIQSCSFFIPKRIKFVNKVSTTSLFWSKICGYLCYQKVNFEKVNSFIAILLQRGIITKYNWKTFKYYIGTKRLKVFLIIFLAPLSKTNVRNWRKWGGEIYNVSTFKDGNNYKTWCNVKIA